MKKFLKYSSSILAIVALSACVKVTDHQVRQAKGNNAGQIVIYTGNNGFAETAGLFINDQFIAALPEQHQLVHSLCRGDYVLKARSVLPQTDKKKKIVHITGQQHLRVTEGQTQYFTLNRAPKGWEFVAMDSVPSELKNNDDKLVRRMTDVMLDCK